MSFLTSLQEDIRAIETAVEKVNVSSVKEGISAIETTVQTLVEKQETTDKKVRDVGDDVSDDATVDSGGCILARAAIKPAK